MNNHQLICLESCRLPTRIRALYARHLRNYAPSAGRRERRDLFDVIDAFKWSRSRYEMSWRRTAQRYRVLQRPREDVNTEFRTLPTFDEL